MPEPPEEFYARVQREGLRMPPVHVPKTSVISAGSQITESFTAINNTNEAAFCNLYIEEIERTIDLGIVGSRQRRDGQIGDWPTAKTTKWTFDLYCVSIFSTNFDRVLVDRELTITVTR